MKKVLIALIALIVVTSSVEATVIKPVHDEPQAALVFEKMTVKDFEKLTGKRLNVIQKLKFKIAQKALQKAKPASGGKSQLTAVLLAFFLGGLGIHRFYLGYTWQGIVQLLTLGGLGIWALIDFIRILIGDLQPKDGEYEKTL
jgi:TM2 domain-containing membrane protein YozV